MSEELLIRHCSPTLAGLKTANLFNCEYETEEELKEYLRNINKTLSNKGIRVMPLRYGNNRALIYLFRPDELEKDLNCCEAKKLLEENGYVKKCCGLGKCLARLTVRLHEQEQFPHEIGLFLGYPPEDVRGFMEQGSSCCKCTGTWKVYGDEEAAKKTFARYKKCNEIYEKLYAQGRTMEKLTVPARNIKQDRAKSCL